MVTSTAGLLLLGSMGHYEECPYVTGLPGSCSCGWPEAIEAIEVEVRANEYERGYVHGRIAGEEQERARARERVEGLPPTVVTNGSWDKRGVLHIAHETLGGTQMLDRAAVLALLGEEV